METTVERLEGNKAKITVTVPAADVDKAIAQAYAEAAGKYRIPGFRKGKAPRPVIDNFVGRPAVMADALEAVVSDTYPAVVSENNLRPIESPDMDELAELEAGTDYTYSAEVELRPELTLSSADGIKVNVPPSKATDREVDAQIEYTRERFATLEAVEDRGVEADDFVLLSFTGTVDGEGYEGNSVDKYLYEMGKGLMPKEFDEGLLGHKAGEHVAVEFQIPETSTVEEFVGKTAHFDIEIHEVKRKVLPELNDEYAGNVGGFETLEEYRSDIRQKMDEAKYVGHIREVERGARAALAERLEGDIPEVMVNDRTGQMTRDFLNNLEQRGLSLEQYVQATGASPESLQADIAGSADESVREELALEALFRDKGMEVTEDDINAELAEMSGGGEDALKFGENLRATGAMPILVEQIMHKKAVRWLMDNIEVVEVEPEAAAETTEAEPEAKPKKRARKSTKKDAEAADQPAEKEE